MNAPTATATRGAAFLALALADALGLGLPDPDYITMNPDLAGSTTTSAAGFQFNALHGQDPLPAMQAWADRFGVTVGTRPGTSDPGTTWHEFDFTHAGVRIHAYASIAAATGDDPVPCPSVSPDGDACTVEEPGHAWHYGPDEGGGVRRMWDDADAAAAAAPGQPAADTGDEPPCGLRTWGDIELCELPAGHDPLPSCSGKPRPFARRVAIGAVRGLQDPAPVVRVLGEAETEDAR